MLVVIFALAGRVDIDLTMEPVGIDPNGQPVYLEDLWPSHDQIGELARTHVKKEFFEKEYARIFDGDRFWEALDVAESTTFAWKDASTYIKNPPYFDGFSLTPQQPEDITNARTFLLLGDTVTTDHISPAGAIPEAYPAGRYLIENGVPKDQFNSYGSRRGNHEVMMRGTFANIRLRKLMAPGTEGGVTRYQPSGEEMSIFDAAMRYQAEATPAIVLAGKEYGSGSSRDWAAKGPRLLGVRAVIAESYERIHRSNLVGMGILPLEFLDGANAQSLGLTGSETFDIVGLNNAEAKQVEVQAVAADGSVRTFPAKVRIDTPNEVDYYRHGGILQYVLRKLAA
jgi:aconitate hydratase